MFVLVTYDVNTESAAGRKRLAKIAKICMSKGQRVQNSVFECLLEPADYVKLKSDIGRIIDPVQDSVRLYYMGDNYKQHIELIGTQPINRQDDILVL